MLAHPGAILPALTAVLYTDWSKGFEQMALRVGKVRFCSSFPWLCDKWSLYGCLSLLWETLPPLLGSSTYFSL